MPCTDPILLGIAEFTDGQIAPLEEFGLDEWIGSWAPMMLNLTNKQVPLPLELKVPFMQEIAAFLDDMANDDEDFCLLGEVREAYLAYLDIDPKVENYCTVWAP